MREVGEGELTFSCLKSNLKMSELDQILPNENLI